MLSEYVGNLISSRTVRQDSEILVMNVYESAKIVLTNVQCRVWLGTHSLLRCGNGHVNGGAGKIFHNQPSLGIHQYSF